MTAYVHFEALCLAAEAKDMTVGLAVGDPVEFFDNGGTLRREVEKITVRRKPSAPVSFSEKVAGDGLDAASKRLIKRIKAATK
jgi:hypothetical protein